MLYFITGSSSSFVLLKRANAPISGGGRPCGVSRIVVRIFHHQQQGRFYASLRREARASRHFLPFCTKLGCRKRAEEKPSNQAKVAIDHRYLLLDQWELLRSRDLLLQVALNKTPVGMRSSSFFWC